MDMPYCSRETHGLRLPQVVALRDTTILKWLVLPVALISNTIVRLQAAAPFANSSEQSGKGDIHGHQRR